MQGELADHENLTADVANAAVHLARFVGKDPHGHHFAGEPVDVGCGVSLLNPSEHHQPRADRCHLHASDRHTRPADPLNYPPHHSPSLTTRRT